MIRGRIRLLAAAAGGLAACPIRGAVAHVEVWGDAAQVRLDGGRCSRVDLYTLLAFVAAGHCYVVVLGVLHR